MRCNSWSAEEESFLAEVYPTWHMPEILKALNERFGKGRTDEAVKSRAIKLGLRKVDGFQRNPPKMWTPEKVEWFVSFVPGHTEPEISAEHERLYGFPLTEGQIGNAKTKFGVRSGTAGGRFEKGQEPPNKGRKRDEFMPADAQERCRATQFKKGNMPHNGHQLIGTERRDKDGYVWVKTAMRKTDPKSSHDNWTPKHRLIYEQAHGPIPEGCMVVFLDGDRENFDPDNLAIETKSEHAVIARHHLEFHDAETHAVARAVARLKSAKYKAKRKERTAS